MIDITGYLAKSDVKQYIQPIEIGAGWVAYKDPQYPPYEASEREARYNRDGEAAFYIASGDATAQANVPDWRGKTKYEVAPQVITCFDLSRFSKDNGLTEEYLRHKAVGGYPLPQDTATLLLRQYGVTGTLYTSVPDSGTCIVLRPEIGRVIGTDFFVTGALP
jgi:hypothetical protein